MTEPEFRTYSFHLATRYKVLMALIVILLVAMVLGIVLSALSIAAVAVLAGAAVAGGTWLAYKVRSLGQSARNRLSGRKNDETRYDSRGRKELEG